MKGLIIKEHWVDLILEGKKTWEIRGSNTKIRGKISLIKSGTGQIFGECELVDSFECDILDMYVGNHEEKHCIPFGQGIKISYKKTYAWVMKNPVRYDKPIHYKHPQGAVIWVNVEVARC